MGATQLRRRGPLLPALAVVAAAIATAGATRDWWLIPLGAAAGAALLFLVPPPGARLPRGLDARHRAIGERLLGAQRTLQAELAPASVELRALFKLSDDRLVEVADLALKLAGRHQMLEARCVELAQSSHASARASLQVRAREEQDVRARESFERALSAREGALSHLVELRRALSRIEGELAAVQAALDASVAQVAKVNLLPPHQKAKQRTEALLSVSATLDGIARDLTLAFCFERTTDEDA